MTLINFLPSFSSKTVESIWQDLVVAQSKSNHDCKKSQELYVFSDGNCKGNGKKNAKAGFSVFFSGDEDSDLFKFNHTELLIESECTNNKAELSGIKYIFQTICDNQDCFQNKNIIICSDSMYSIHCIEKWSKSWVKNGWKTSKGDEVKNKELIEEILNIKQKIPRNISITFRHVDAHRIEPKDKNSLAWILWYGNKKVDDNINELFEHIVG